MKNLTFHTGECPTQKRYNETPTVTSIFRIIWYASHNIGLKLILYLMTISECNYKICSSDWPKEYLNTI